MKSILLASICALTLASQVWVVEARPDAPDVVGMEVREAHDLLTAAGFAPALEVGPDAPTAEAAYTILSQREGVGNEIILVVYGNLAVAPRSVPSLVGLRLDEAETLLRERGLFSDLLIDQVPALAEDIGTVYRQYPEPGIEVPRGIGIRIWVYASPDEDLERAPREAEVAPTPVPEPRGGTGRRDGIRLPLTLEGPQGVELKLQASATGAMSRDGFLACGRDCLEYRNREITYSTFSFQLSWIRPGEEGNYCFSSLGPLFGSPDAHGFTPVVFYDSQSAIRLILACWNCNDLESLERTIPVSTAWELSRGLFDQLRDQAAPRCP